MSEPDMLTRPHIGQTGVGALLLLASLALYQAAGSWQRSLTATPPSAMIAVADDGVSRPAVAERAPEPSLPSTAGPALVIPPGRPAVRVPILMYHYIRQNPDPRDQLGFNLSVTPEDFASQMDWLAANGFHPVNLEDVHAYLQGRTGLPARPVVLTFDDGYRDVYTTAFPILRFHHFKAVAYIVSGFLGFSNNVTPDMVQEMDAGGIQIASHTVSHVDLTKTPQPELDRQLQESRATLEAVVGHPVLDFCYPSGAVNPRVVDAVAAAGYRSSTTTAPGNVHSEADRFLWGRVRVSGGERLDRFAAELAAEEPAVLATGVPLPQPPPTSPRLQLVFPLSYSQTGPATDAPAVDPQP